ncbi:MAG: hypothetical protein HY813_01835 [Candidatus Portnoybacteria bacterium]|nr:hypothetical protein [Candidatus Portnoybacteria bacterium]
MPFDNKKDVNLGILLPTHWFLKIFHLLSSVIAKHLDSITAIVDSSFVETYSKHDECGSEYSGHKKKNGFKLHQIIRPVA